MKFLQTSQKIRKFRCSTFWAVKSFFIVSRLD